ncbi:MAG: hypothetical protein JW996_01870 [Candidatus Cloacimonetes bacterium]|nr:hypothetical protein [Candidatus Cloacimonadota bacterium]
MIWSILLKYSRNISVNRSKYIRKAKRNSVVNCNL